jgi:hypothetical protein
MQKISFFEPYISMIRPVNFILFCLFFLFLLSCKKDEDDPITLNAEAGLNQIVEINETPFMNCFGVDVYKVNEELVSEFDYAKYKV